MKKIKSLELTVDGQRYALNKELVSYDLNGNFTVCKNCALVKFCGESTICDVFSLDYDVNFKLK